MRRETPIAADPDAAKPAPVEEALAELDRRISASGGPGVDAVGAIAPGFCSPAARPLETGLDQRVRWVAGLVVNAAFVAGLGWVLSLQRDSGAGLERPKWKTISLTAPVPELTPPPVIPRPELPRPKLPAPAAERRKAVLPEVAKVVPKPLAPPPELPTPPVPKPATIATAPVPTAPPNLPPPAPKPVVGMFSSPTPASASTKPREGVQAANFGSSGSPNSTVKRPEVALSQFDGTASAVPAKGQRAVVTGETGFGAATADSSRKSKAVLSADAGFGSQTPSESRRKAANVESTGFDNTAPAERKRAAAAVEGEFRAVEILTKPRPNYTEPARRLGIEGEVHVRVRFGMDGKLQVLSIEKGLGHGLDENAAIAVSRIEFRPATRRGVPVEQLAVIRVQFQLAQ